MEYSGVVIKLLFEPRDLWVGVFWDRDAVPTPYGPLYTNYRVYVCIVPMFAIKVSWKG